ncbi:hypothetical protein SteCoe_25276 [Stentor coeruleus]|uniref:Uncharacterized protein n=1 Tax=Stentor coeruleus TaxID=5963 RepID=A0A1R2BFI9_9CILI|nr:hypothetical protein SteCoe_25276 [Stentor coeruleus]
MLQEYNDRAKLAEAKQLRKRADEDARLLANRIALLKLEEQKALKKIEETRKKTQEIVETRSRNYHVYQKLEDTKRMKDEQYSLKIEQIRQDRERISQIRQQANKNREDQINQEIRSLKISKQNNLKTIEFKKFEDLSEKVSKKNKIKEQEKEAEEKRKKLQEERAEKARAENIKKMEEQILMRKLKEERLAKLEQDELELIQRLQNTQLLQRNAYEDLETALSGNNL